MNKEKTLKLILYKDSKEVKKILEKNTQDGLRKILDMVESWKEKDRERNTVKFIIGVDRTE